MHNQLSLYFLFCIMTSFFYAQGTLTTLLLIMLLIIHQYIYYLIFLTPTMLKPVSYCTECSIMTTSHYVHCKECQCCFPVTHFHWKAFQRCVSRQEAKRYKTVVFIQIVVNLFCSLLQSIIYPPFILIFFTTVFSCKSIMSKLEMDI